jgi:uncharacterized protein (TIGR04141 family)
VRPLWPAGIHEGPYNKLIAEKERYVLLDQREIHTGNFTGGGLGIADALGPAGELICIKKASQTAPLNHLFAQGRVAVETLRFDNEARGKLLAMLPDDRPVNRTFRAPTVVYACY